ncbi:MAG: polysaccharide biosynthesis tyrosine autokinase [Novosphingobium sp.]
MTDNETNTLDAGQPGRMTGRGTGLESFASAPVAGPAYGGYARALDPGEILRIINKWKRLIIAAVILGPLIALGLSLMMTPRYEASAQLKIDQEDPVIIPGSGSASPIVVNRGEFLATQVGLLNSRTLAQRVVDAQRLAGNPAYADQSASAAQRRDSATERLRAQVTIDIVRDSRLVNITIASANAIEAAGLANAYADQFIASNLERDFDATAYARRFLEDRINSTRDRLEKSERDVVAYATQQGIVELGAADDKGGKPSLESSTLVELNTALAEARNQRITAEQRFRQVRSNAATTEAINNPVLQDLTRKRADALAEYQEKSAVFLPGLPAQVALKQRIESLDREIAKAQGNVGSASRLEYDGAVAREHELQTRLDGMKDTVLDLRKRSIQYTILQREVDTNRALYEALLQKYKEVGVSGGVGNNKVSVVDHARVPGGPVSPKVLWNVMLGLLTGIGLGLGAAFLLEFIDDTIKLPDDVASKLNMSLLGIMPSAPEGHDFVTEVQDPKSDLVEAAHSLRTSLQFATGHGVPRSVLITSSRPGEGKSSVSLALCASLARQGRKVLLIDADMRKPTYYISGESRSDTAGLSNVLSGELTLDQATHDSAFENLQVIMAGPSVPNPAALLSEGGFASLLAQAAAKYDHVLIDGPPVMGLADAPIMGSIAEAVIIIVESASVYRSTIQAAMSRLKASNSRILGVVLNKFESRKTGYGYGYGYAYSYSYGGTRGKEGSPDDRKIVIVK